MLYSKVIDDALEDAVGKAGLSHASLARELDRAAVALDNIRRWKEDGTLPLLSWDRECLEWPQPTNTGEAELTDYTYVCI